MPPLHQSHAHHDRHDLKNTSRAWRERGHFYPFVGPLRWYYVSTASLSRSHCAQRAFTTWLWTMLRATLAWRLHCAHSDFTATKRIALRGHGAVTEREQRSSRFHYTLTTLLGRLNHALMMCPLRWDKYRSASGHNHHCSSLPCRLMLSILYNIAIINKNVIIVNIA